MGLVRHEICETWVKISFLLCNSLKNVEAIMAYLLYIFADKKEKTLSIFWVECVIMCSIECYTI